MTGTSTSQVRTGGMPRGLARTGPILFSYGFRPFFLGGALWAIAAMVLWIAALSGVVDFATETLGVAEFKLGHVQSALRAFERSRQLKPDFADTYYNLACVQARLGDRRQALDYLRRAVFRYGFAEPEFMSGDPDLIKLLKDDPEFNELVRKAEDQRLQQTRTVKRARKGRR